MARLGIGSKGKALLAGRVERNRGRKKRKVGAAGQGGVELDERKQNWGFYTVMKR